MWISKAKWAALTERMGAMEKELAEVRRDSGHYNWSGHRIGLYDSGYTRIPVSTIVDRILRHLKLEAKEVDAKPSYVELRPIEDRTSWVGTIVTPKPKAKKK